MKKLILLRILFSNNLSYNGSSEIGLWKEAYVVGFMFEFSPFIWKILRDATATDAASRPVQTYINLASPFTLRH